MTRRDIVVVGASAGGVPALQALAAGLPATLPATVLVVMHITPYAESRLADILNRAGPLPAEAARDGAPIVPGRIYVSVPDRHLLVEKNRLRVTRGPKENRTRPAVDVLFRSAAYACGPRVIGIVLSGNLDDGTAGLWAIKDRGGIALVQSTEEAQYPSMPESAIQQIAVDRIISVRDMPALLTSYMEETIMGTQRPPISETMTIETRIALGDDPLPLGTLQLGPITPNTCPECHGTLTRIEEGTLVRYRCHIGHAYSQQSLFAQVDEGIDHHLLITLRAADERMILLQQLEQRALANGDPAKAERYAQRIHATDRWKQRLREMMDEFGTLEQYPAQIEPA
jgi:two-component system chemotaxis response regulator CheB